MLHHWVSPQHTPITHVGLLAALSPPPFPGASWEHLCYQEQSCITPVCGFRVACV